MGKGTTKTRYTDTELQEFKIAIEKKLKKARTSIKDFNSLKARDGVNGTNDTSPTFKVLEEGQKVNAAETNSKLAGRQVILVESLENALIRIENRTYGICRITGKLISKQRLKAVPHTTTSILAKKLEETGIKKN